MGKQHSQNGGSKGAKKDGKKKKQKQKKGVKAQSSGVDGVEEVARLEAGLKDAHHLNNLSTLIPLVAKNDKDGEVAMAALHACRRFFTDQCHPETALLHAPSSSNKKQKTKHGKRRRGAGGDGEGSAQEKLRDWVRQRYVQFVHAVLQHWLSGSRPVVEQLAALRTLLMCCAVDAHMSGGGSTSSFGHETLASIVRHLVSTEGALTMETLHVLRDEFLNDFLDIRCYTMRALTGVLDAFNKERTTSASSADGSGGGGAGGGAGAGAGAGSTVADRPTGELYAANAFDLLSQVVMQFDEEELSEMTLMGYTRRTQKSRKRGREGDSDGDDGDGAGGEGSGVEVSSTPVPGSRVTRVTFHVRCYGEAWLALLRLPLSPLLYRKVLLVLPTRVIPFLPSPLVLADFLTDAYNQGGATSVLALQSLFTLIVNHNLEYPKFYVKLYSLLEPSVILSKYRARFFKLLGKFMASSHLPAYMVAAYIKRLAWLALRSPPSTALYLVPFVYNLLKRHPSCITLIHRTGAKPAADTAPATEAQQDIGYDAAVDKPFEANAMQASLFEVQALLKHYVPSVSSLTKVFESPLNKQAYDLESFATHSYDTVFAMECKRRLKQGVPTTFEAPAALFPASDSLCATSDVVSGARATALAAGAQLVVEEVEEAAEEEGMTA